MRMFLSPIFHVQGRNKKRGYDYNNEIKIQKGSRKTEKKKPNDRKMYPSCFEFDYYVGRHARERKIKDGIPIGIYMCIECD